MYFQLTDNQFGIFYPEDVHAPMIGEGEIKKVVIKFGRKKKVSTFVARFTAIENVL